MNYFEMYPGDYLRDTSDMSLAEHGAYLLLLAHYYSSERPLPDDMSVLYRITRATTRREKEVVRKIADRFFPAQRTTFGPDSDAKLRRNRRADIEIEKASRRITAARENGAKNIRKSRDGPTHWVSQRDSHGESQRSSRQHTHSGEALHTPHAIEALGNSPASALRLEGARATAGEICKGMREMGCLHVNPSKIELLAALAEGVSADALLDAAQEALSKGKQDPFGWAIATARGRHADGPIAIHAGEPDGPCRQPGDGSLCDRVERACREGDDRDRRVATG